MIRLKHRATSLVMALALGLGLLFPLPVAAAQAPAAEETTSVEPAQSASEGEQPAGEAPAEEAGPAPEPDEQTPEDPAPGAAATEEASPPAEAAATPTDLAGAGDVELPYVPGEVLVVFKPQVSQPSAEGLMAAQSVEPQEYLQPEEPEVAVVAEIPDDMTVDEAIETFEAMPEVDFAQPNYLYYPMESYTPNDPGTSNQWHLSYVNQAGAWERLAGLEGREKVTVAVIDSPVQLAHPDLAANLDTEHARNFVGFSTSTAGDNTDGEPLAGNYVTTPGDHGTHVAGIIGAVANNRLGIAGVGSGPANEFIEMMPLNVFSYSGYTSASSGVVDAAIRYAVRNEAKVINLSLGSLALKYDTVNGVRQNYRYDDYYLQRGVAYAAAQGVTVIAAAGNNGMEWDGLEWDGVKGGNDPGTTGLYKNLPSDFPSVISVINLMQPGTARYQQDGVNVRSSGSNYGHKDISAPGAGIYSTIPTSTYGSKSGTSMAAPIVSAVAAMMLYANPQLEPEKIRTLLRETATDVYTPGYDSHTAAGCVNADAAVAAALDLVAAPGNLAVEQTAEGMQLSWNAVEGALYYELEYQPDDYSDFEPLHTTANGTVLAYLDAGRMDYAYRYRIRCLADIEGKEYLSDWSPAVLAVPTLATPTDLTLVEGAGGSLHLSWSPVPGAEGYRVFGTAIVGGEYFSILEHNIDATSYVDIGRGTNTMGHRMWYKVAALRRVDGRIEEGPLTEVVTGVRSTPAPTGLAVEQRTNTSLTLSWNHLPDADTYLLYRAVDGGSYTGPVDITGFAVAGGKVRYVDSDITPAGTYKYKLAAQVTYWEEVTLTGPAGPAVVSLVEVPAAPRALAAAPGALALSWDAVPEADGYYIWRSLPQSGQPAEKIGKVGRGTSYNDTGYYPALEYHYTVQAYFTLPAGGESQESLGGHSPALELPAANMPVENLRVTATGADSITLAWDAWENFPLESRLSYLLERSTDGFESLDGPAIPIDDHRTGRYTDAGLAPGHYSYRLWVALDGEPMDTASSPVAARTSAVQMNETPFSCISTRYDSLTLIWTAAPAAEGYVVYRAASAAGPWEQLALVEGRHATTYTDTGLEYKTPYFYRVRAMAWVDGEMMLSQNHAERNGDACFTTLAPPQPAVEATALGSLTISWEPVPGATGYLLAHMDPEQEGYLVFKVLNGKTFSYTLTGLTPADENSYAMLSVRKVAGQEYYSSLSNEVDGIPTAAPAPAAFTAHSAAGSHRVSLAWEPVEGAAGYALYRDGKLLKNLGKVDSYLEKALAPGSYRYTLAARYKSGKLTLEGVATSTDITVEPWSGAATLTVEAPDVGTLHQATLKWGALEGADGYLLYRDGVLIKSLKTTSYTDKNVRTGEYYYSVAPYKTIDGKACAGLATDFAMAHVLSAVGDVGAPEVTPPYPFKYLRALLTWYPVDDADGYNIYRAEYPFNEADYKLVKKHGRGTINDNYQIEWTDTLPKGNTQYKYRIAAVAGSKRQEGTYAYSSPFIGSPSPDELRLYEVSSEGLGSITASWSETYYVDGYTLRAEPTDPDSTQKPVEKVVKGNRVQSVATITGLVPGQYRVRLAAWVNGGGKRWLTWQPAEQDVLVTVQQFAAPENLRLIRAAVGEVELAWEKVTTTTAGAAAGPSGYSLYRKYAGEDDYQLVKHLGAGATKYVDKGVTPGTASYRLVAYKTVSGKKYAGTAAATLAVEVAGPAPAGSPGVTAGEAPHTVRFSWEKAAAGGPTGYLLQRAASPAGPWATAATVKTNKTKDKNGYTHTLANQPEGGWYYRVVAYKAFGKTQITGAGAAFYREVAGLPAVADATATADGLHTLQLEWGRVETATHYRVWRVEGGAATLVASPKARRDAQQKLKLTGQPTGAGEYLVAPVYTVKGLSAVGPTTRFTQAQPVQGLPAPTAAPTAESAGPYKLALEWPSVKDASGYFIQRAEAQNGDYVTVATQSAKKGDSQRATVSNLSTAGGRWFRVQPYRSVGKQKLGGAPSAAVEHSVSGLSVLGGYAAVTDIGVNSLTLSIARVEGATHHRVYRVDPAEGMVLEATIKAGRGASQSHTLKGQPTGAAEYYLQPVVISKSFEGADTPRVKARLEEPVKGLNAPEEASWSQTEAQRAQQKLTVRWEKVAKAAGYYVYRVDGDTQTLVATAAGGSKTSVSFTAPGGPGEYRVAAYSSSGGKKQPGNLAIVKPQA